MGTELEKLYFGCGNLDYHDKGYRNVDVRRFPHVDYLVDISERLPWPDNSVGEIYAESVLEHIPHGFRTGASVADRAHVKTIKVLREWYRVLKVGGKCIIKVPNIRGICFQYTRNNITPRDFWMYIYGGQEYKENTHLSGFDPATLKGVLQMSGFKDVSISNAHDLSQALAENDAWEMVAVAIKNAPLEYEVVMDVKRAGEILIQAKEIFDNCRTEVFLICGTCLGAIREGIILPYDGDIDLGVKHEILKEKIPLLEEKFLDSGYTVEKRSCQYGYPRSIDFRKDGIHVCVRDYDLSGDKRFHARIISPDNTTKDGTCSIFDRKLFENLKKIEFFGREFLVPNTPEAYLKAHYGDWETPDPTEHGCKADIENSFTELIKGKS